MERVSTEFSQSHEVVRSHQRTVKALYQWASQQNHCLVAITVAFGVRNLENRDQGLKDIRRSLRPGGKFFILEFSQPYQWFRPIYYSYLKYVLPAIAGWITRKPEAYDYLGDSIEGFPSTQKLIDELEAAGFRDMHVTRMTLGIVAIHEGTA